MNHNFISGILLAQKLIKKYPNQKNFYLTCSASEAETLVKPLVEYLTAHGKQVRIALFWMTEVKGSNMATATRSFVEPALANSRQVCILTEASEAKNYCLIGESQELKAQEREIVYFTPSQFPKDKTILKGTKKTKHNLKIIITKPELASPFLTARRNIWIKS